MKILMTGGGTSGHITPNIALIPDLRKRGYDIAYIGSKDSIEERLLSDIEIPFYSIRAGKLRRYFDMENLKDFFRVLGGFRDSIKDIRKIKPQLLFSKGGYVTSPVVWAARLFRIPVIIHESDITPGLANKLSLPFATKVCYAFPESKRHLPEDKAIYTGLPIREELTKGSKEKGLSLCIFDDQKPIITIMGGSLGSKVINEVIRENLDLLLDKYQVCHLCGKNNLADIQKKGYIQFEYVSDELKDLLAMTDIFVSRAGATTLFEILELGIPNILIPLSKKASRGDQILNAASFEDQGFSLVIQEEDFTKDLFLRSLSELDHNYKVIKTRMLEANQDSAVDKICNLIDKRLK